MGGYKSFRAVVEQVPAEHRHLRHSQPHITLSIWTVYGSSSFTYTERFMVAESPLIPLHSRVSKRASAQATTCTGDTCTTDVQDAQKHAGTDTDMK